MIRKAGPRQWSWTSDGLVLLTGRDFRTRSCKGGEMKKYLLALAILLAFAEHPGVAQNTKATMTTEVNTNLPDNTTGLITPAITRTTLNAIVTAYQQTPKTHNIGGSPDTIMAAALGH